jgi:uncharacterized protein
MTDPKMPARIILFCRYPSPGKVKTRLIPALGAVGAARLQKALLLRTAAQTEISAERNDAAVEVRFTGSSKRAFEALLKKKWRYTPQGSGDLGVRMDRAIRAAIEEGVSRVVLVGADIPRLSAKVLDEGLDALRRRDAVIGPAEDGGYYLIGMRRPCAEIFKDMPWGTGAVCRLTEARLLSRRVRFEMLEVLADLDRPEDLVWMADSEDGTSPLGRKNSGMDRTTQTDRAASGMPRLLK